MASDLSDDDGYMYRLALDLLHKHGHSARPSAGPGAEREDAAFDTLMPAVLATRHVLVWHVGAEPSASEVEAFGREFPDWGVIDAVCSGRITLRPYEEPGAEARIEHGGRDIPLARLCGQFLEAYAHRHLNDGRAAADRSAPPRDVGRRARLASDIKRG